MPEADTSSITSRRCVIAATIGALASVPAAALATGAEHPDADLLRDLARFDELERISEAADKEDFEAWKEWKPASMREQASLLLRICATPARTLDGLRARARSLILWAPELAEGADDQNADWDSKMLGALLRDLAGEATP